VVDMRAFFIILIAIAIYHSSQNYSKALDVRLSSMKYRINEEKQDCTNQKWRLGYKEALIDDVEKFANLIEQVPPDERKYLEEELRSGVEGRLRLAFRRPSYKAFDVHRDAKRVIDYLNRLSTEPLDYLSKGAIDALGSYFSFYQAFDDYIQFDFQRPTRVIPKDEIGRVYESLQFLKGNIGNYAKCLVDAIGK